MERREIVPKRPKPLLGPQELSGRAGHQPSRFNIRLVGSRNGTRMQEHKKQVQKLQGDLQEAGVLVVRRFRVAKAMKETTTWSVPSDRIGWLRLSRANSIPRRRVYMVQEGSGQGFVLEACKSGRGVRGFEASPTVIVKGPLRTQRGKATLKTLIFVGLGL